MSICHFSSTHCRVLFSSFLFGGGDGGGGYDDVKKKKNHDEGKYLQADRHWKKEGKGKDPHCRSLEEKRKGPKKEGD